MDFGSDLNFIRASGSCKSTDRWADKFRFNGYYGLQIVLDGKIAAAVNDHPLEYSNGPVVFVTYPGAAFSYGSPPGTHRDCAYICFAGKRVEEYIACGLLELRERDLFIPLTDSGKFFQTTKALLRNLALPGDKLHHARAVHLLEELLFQLHEAKSGGAQQSIPWRRELRELCSRIAEHPELEWDFEKEASQLQLSYAHFRRLFPQATGFSPKQFLLECRLRQAEHLLTSGNARISEIADLCGFESNFHLFRIFRKHRQLAPSEYRKKYTTAGK